MRICGGRSVGIVRSRAPTMEFSFSLNMRIFNVVWQTEMQTDKPCMFQEERNAAGLAWWTKNFDLKYEKKNLRSLSPQANYTDRDKRQSLGRYSSLADSGHGVPVHNSAC
jgi:hypothetical protein